MALVDLLTPEAIEALRQAGLNWLDQFGRVAQDLLRDNDLEITFRVKAKEKKYVSQSLEQSGSQLENLNPGPRGNCSDGVAPNGQDQS